jgi:CheY-like chemotaxis protein
LQTVLIKPLKREQILLKCSELIHAAAAPVSAVSGSGEKGGEAEKSSSLNRYFDALGGTRWLLAEDNLINQEVIKILLEELNITLDLAENGVEAIHYLERYEYDGVLSDIQMPEMDGFELVARIREHEAWKRLPVIAITAHAMPGYREKCIAAGMNDYLSKPVDQIKLYEMMSHFVCSGPRQTQKAMQTAEQRVEQAAVSDVIGQVDAGGGGSQSDGETPTSVEPLPPGIWPDSLPGLNVAQALKRVGGNRQLLERVMSAFLLQFEHVEDQLLEHVDEQDWEEAFRLMHTLKGLAGTIGAQMLDVAIKPLLSSLRGWTGRHPPETFDADFEQFQKEIRQVRISLGKLVNPSRL